MKAEDDFREDFEQLKLLAETGDSDAEEKLAYCYSAGQGTKRNRSLAIHWRKKAAAHGNTSAMCQLALAYRNGVGVLLNSREAYRWLAKAASLGHESAAMACETEKQSIIEPSVIEDLILEIDSGDFSDEQKQALHDELQRMRKSCPERILNDWEYKGGMEYVFDSLKSEFGKLSDSGLRQYIDEEADITSANHQYSRSFEDCMRLFVVFREGNKIQLWGEITWGNDLSRAKMLFDEFCGVEEFRRWLDNREDATKELYDKFVDIRLKDELRKYMRLSIELIKA